MKQFLIFVNKEFKHALRDRKTLLILFGLPIIQIILFGFALTNEIKNSNIAILDYSRDNLTEQIISKIEASSYFEIERMAHDLKDIEKAFRTGSVKTAVIFPAGFANDFSHLNKANVQIITDGSDPNTATALNNYINAIILEYNQQVALQGHRGLSVIPELRMLYNPELKGAYNFVPGVMALVLFLVCVLMTSISIVREKEFGTMEVLLVSPFKPLLVIISKAIPYLIVSITNLTIILLLSVFALGLPIKGSIFLLVSLSILYIITSLTLGLLISTVTSTQQIAMLLSLMGLMLPTMIFAGFMFPIENMPLPLQVFSNIVPAKWYYIIVKSVMIKGLGISSIWKEVLILSGMTVLILVVSLLKFKTRLE